MSSGRVSRGSMISSTPKTSAVRIGSRREPSFSSSSARSCVRIVGRLELALVRGLHAALDRQRAPLARRPRVARARPRVVRMARAGHAERLAHDDRAPRHAGLVDRGRSRARPRRMVPAFFAARPIRKTGFVDEVPPAGGSMQHQVDQAGHLVGRRTVDGAAGHSGHCPCTPTGRPASRASPVHSSRRSTARSRRSSRDRARAR